MYNPYYVVLYDREPGYCSQNKSFPVGEDGKEAAKTRAEEEAKRLKNIGYYIYDIQYHNPAIWLEAELYGLPEDDEDEKEETEEEKAAEEEAAKKAAEEKAAKKAAEEAKKAAEEEARLATYGDEQDVAVLEVLYNALQQSKKPKMIINYAGRFCPRFKSGRFEQPQTIIRAGGREYAFQPGLGWERIL